MVYEALFLNINEFKPKEQKILIKNQGHGNIFITIQTTSNETLKEEWRVIDFEKPEEKINEKNNLLIIPNKNDPIRNYYTLSDDEITELHIEYQEYTEEDIENFENQCKNFNYEEYMEKYRLFNISNLDTNTKEAIKKHKEKGIFTYETKTTDGTTIKEQYIVKKFREVISWGYIEKFVITKPYKIPKQNSMNTPYYKHKLGSDQMYYKIKS